MGGGSRKVLNWLKLKLTDFCSDICSLGRLKVPVFDHHRNHFLDKIKRLLQLMVEVNTKNCDFMSLVMTSIRYCETIELI